MISIYSIEGYLISPGYFQFLLELLSLRVYLIECTRFGVVYLAIGLVQRWGCAAGRLCSDRGYSGAVGCTLALTAGIGFILGKKSRQILLPGVEYLKHFTSRIYYTKRRALHINYYWL